MSLPAGPLLALSGLFERASCTSAFVGKAGHLRRLLQRLLMTQSRHPFARASPPHGEASYCTSRNVESGKVCFGSLADISHAARACPLFARKQTKRCNQLRGRLNSLLGAMCFPVCNEKFPVPIAGKFVPESLVFQLVSAGGEGRFKRNSLYFPADQGISETETRSLQPPSTATLSTCYRTILCLSGIG